MTKPVETARAPLDREAQVTWPYLDHEVYDALNPVVIERHGREIVARAAINGRLVAFLGAGVSMAYGRISWIDLVRQTLVEVARIDPERYLGLEQTHARIGSRLRTLEHDLGVIGPRDGKRQPPDPLPEHARKRPLLLLQLCADILDLAVQGEKTLHKRNPREVRSLAEIYDRLLKDSTHRDNALAAAWKRLGSKGLQAPLQASVGALPPGPLPARRHLLRVIAGQADTEPRTVDELHSNRADSAIAQLLHDMQIRRFATTNYDLEIERALSIAAWNRPAAGTPADATEDAIDRHYDSFSLAPEHTGRAVAFALEGRRRHAMVMHLHGAIDEPRTIIASERDYQERYLRPSQRRDLLDNAIRTLFGANPLLYIGSGISEDDVLRPLREFMSFAPRRTDRLGVALMPAALQPSELVSDKIDALVRYGIHTIHYGHDSPQVDDPANAGKESWLCQFTDQLKRVRKHLEALMRWKADSGPLPLLTRDKFTLRAPRHMDGQPTDRPGSEAHAIDAECRLFNAIVDLCIDRPQEARDCTSELMLLLNEISSSVVSGFLCARLVTEARFMSTWARRTLRPADPVATRAPIAAGDREPAVYCHMAPALAACAAGQSQAGLPERMHFRAVESAPTAAIAVDDPRWHRLADSLRSHAGFQRNDGRRLLLLPFPRGSGRGSMFDQLVLHRPEALLMPLQDLLAPTRGRKCHWRTGLISLNYLCDVSNVVEVLTGVIDPELAAEPRPAIGNLLGRFEQALDRLAVKDGQRRRAGEKCAERVLLVLSNVGVLFDADGQPKNGQLARLLALLTDPRYRLLPIDFMVFCDDRHVPQSLLLSGQPAEGAGPQALRRLGAIETAERYEREPRLVRRGIAPLDRNDPAVHVHVPQRSLAREVAAAFIGPVAPDGEIDRKLVQLHHAVAGNRIALTLLLALAAEECAGSSDTADRADARLVGWLDTTAVTLAARTHERTPAVAIHHVHDRWALLHQRNEAWLLGGECGAILTHWLDPRLTAEERQRLAPASGRPIRISWRLTEEILWHLSVFSHPVEVAVLDQCPAIRTLALEWLRQLRAAPAGYGRGDEKIEQKLTALIGAMTEIAVHRCLALRLAPRQLGGAGTRRRHVGDPIAPDDDQPPRYTVHRMIQRHFIRMMGGRDIEGIEWDQFTTSLYASQPDEIPTLSTDAHRKIRRLIKSLSRYALAPGYANAWVDPPKDDDDAPADDGIAVAPPGRDRLREFQALRAAYFVARSTYSVGVLSHIAAQTHSSDRQQPIGHMEEYRRLIRWITHRAQTLQDAQPQAGGSGFFHRGELVWLYAECGVMSLTQGKLEDAEALLNLALRAVRGIECDDTGPLHVRLLLQLALVRIERGRAHSAVQLLKDIARRHDEHPVPRLIAEFHLGLIEHLGGEYHSAARRYETALAGFRKHNRSRATAFVLKCQADLHMALAPDRGQEAIALALEAIAVAQRGGHEDVHMLALLTLVRLRTAADPSRSHTESYRQIEVVEQYGLDMGMPRIQAAAHLVRACVLLSQGETKLSAREAVTSAEIAALYDLKLYKAKALLTLAQIYKRRDEHQQARDLIRVGFEIANAAEYFSCVRGFRSLEATLVAESGAGDDSL
ncbi:SIR2 family NAD-dependent protein deacylase [Derxia lacustris]|uniref:SIR2 family NAD-dependent protein deacylase n=1 Tax=Derxia lacustris TaxID=764842 RepID=UPI000A16FF40|nr:SIR2 family protein [Derxia lacustris]